MKNKFLKVINFIQQKQTGLFRVAVLLIMVYWTYLLHDIADNMPELWSVESELGSISSKLDDIDSTLSFHSH